MLLLCLQTLLQTGGGGKPIPKAARESSSLDSQNNINSKNLMLALNDKNIEFNLRDSKQIYTNIESKNKDSINLALNEKEDSKNCQGVDCFANTRNDATNIESNPQDSIILSLNNKQDSKILLLADNADNEDSNANNTNTESNNETTQSNDTINTSNIKTYNLEKVAVTAKGTEQLLKDAPASITVITGEELENRPHRDLAEALVDIPGIDLQGDKQGKTGGLNINIRGLEGKYTLILIDGKRQTSGADVNTADNSGWTQANTSFMPPLSAIERIEVIRGPMSTLYGSDAIGGVVNIITKKKIDKFGISASVESVLNENRQFGDSYIVNLFTTIPIIKDTLGVQLRGRYYYRAPSNLRFTYTDMNGVKQNMPDDYKQTSQNINNCSTTNHSGCFTTWEHERKTAHIYDIGGRILWNPNEQNNLYFDAQFGSQYYDNPNEAIGPYSITAPVYKVFNNNYLLSHRGDYGSWSIDNSIQFIQSFNDGRMTGAYTTPTINRDIQGKDVIVESRAFVDLPFNNSLTIGAQYWYIYMQDLLTTIKHDSYHTFALYLEDEWEILDNLRLTLGVREDYNSRFGFNTSPKGYLVYEAIPDWLILKGGVSMGYKAPYLNQMVSGVFGSNSGGSGGYFGNPDLKPETSLNAEFSVITDNDYFEAGATYFYSLFWDKIALTRLARNTNNAANIAICRGYTGEGFRLGCYLPENVDKSYYQGVETYISMKPLYGFSLDFAYTYMDSQYLTGTNKGRMIEGTANHRFNAKLGYTYKSLYVYVRGEYQGERAKLSDDPWRFYKPYGLMHVGATYKITDNLKLNFAIYNVLNKDFMDLAEFTNSNGRFNVHNRYIQMQEGRRYWLSLNMDF
ncbi:TonB-dependent receptor [Helicobacter saguini]|uniref:TonB-dependent receptor domain-containing protein n=1 Tax=Helicobacter saguini TaxID=1548018 RepID=UPI000E58F43A|nr:TonB-dependent receptor [Helicobacter saguini]MWV71074.1 TonB-dependent receptor [Helicobacter saguini]